MAPEAICTEPPLIVVEPLYALPPPSTQLEEPFFTTFPVPVVFPTMLIMPFIKDVEPTSLKVIVALAALGANESVPPVRLKDVAFNSLT